VKLPFDFGIRFVLRLVWPGAILAAALFPIGREVRALAYPAASDPILFAVLGLVAGFALLLFDMPIYMILEGRRYWPERLRLRGVRREAARLAKIRAVADSAQDSAVRVEYDLRASEFPTDRVSGEPAARYPTRLGNLLASFETYPTVKYGIDGVFFWPRLWVSIDKDLREELDSAQAIVDGAVYSCAAFAVSAVLCATYAAIGVGESRELWLGAAVTSAIFSIICYRAALPRYAQYGELVAAVFDQHRKKLEFDALVTDLDAHLNDTRTPARSERETARAAWRFLRWHRYRRSGAPTNEIVRDW
jgi:hypothetical protein